MHIFVSSFTDLFPIFYRKFLPSRDTEYRIAAPNGMWKRNIDNLSSYILKISKNRYKNSENLGCLDWL